MIQLGNYQHYKGNNYRVIGIARHSETLEEMVVYQDLKNDSLLWVRPALMFIETVEFNNEIVPRFKFISE